MFLTSSVPAKQDPSNDFWYQSLDGTLPTVAGVHVSAESALRLSTVYKCVKAVAETVGTLPRHAYRQGDRKRERDRDHPIARLLRRPNRWQTPQQFFGMLEAHKQLRGNGYAEILYGANYEPQELVPLHPDRCKLEVTADGTPRLRVFPREAGGRERVLVPGEYLHVTGLTMDGYLGINPIQAERESIGAAIAARDYGARFWENDARPPFWIKVPAKFADNEARTSFRSQWQAAYGGVNRHRPAVLDNGMELHALGVSNADSQWLEARKYSEIDICGLFRVPPHKIGILDRATWGNIEHQNIEFVTDCVLTQIIGWEQVIARDLIAEGDDLYVEFLVEQLLRGDTATRYNAYGKGIQDGWLTRNEARELENRDPLPGLDEPLQPLNMTTAGQASLPRPGGQQVQTPGRAAAILAASAERVARKEVAVITRALKGEAESELREFFGSHEGFVADVMAVSREDAAGYCAATLDRALQLLAAGTLGTVRQADWVDTQVAALMRLED